MSSACRIGLTCGSARSFAQDADPTLWSDLLDQAQFLATWERAEARQASLRRAVSTAYYGLFHFLIEEASSALMPASPKGLRATFRRTFEHRTMKSACEAIWRVQASAAPEALLELPLEPELRAMARVFVDLQAARQSADYDLVHPVTRVEALGYIETARDAIAGWHRISGRPNANAFLAHLAGIVGRRRQFDR